MLKRMVLVTLVSAAAACNNGGSSGPSDIPNPTVNPTVETFTGTIDVGGSDTHPFTVALSGGQLTVTLTAAGPPSTIFMGIGVGQWSAPTCTLLSGASTIAPAGATAQLSGTANQGSYCVTVSDVGNQSTQVTYAVTVSHY